MCLERDRVFKVRSKYAPKVTGVDSDEDITPSSELSMTGNFYHLDNGLIYAHASFVDFKPDFRRAELEALPNPIDYNPEDDF